MVVLDILPQWNKEWLDYVLFTPRKILSWEYREKKEERERERVQDIYSEAGKKNFQVLLPKVLV